VKKYFSFLKNVYFFKELNDDDIRKIQSVCHEKKYNAGEVIFKEGSKADRFYIILDGSVEVWKDYDLPKGDILAQHGTGKLFGEMALIDDLPRSATVIAKVPTTLLYINRDDFHRIITENSSIALSIMRSVSLMVRKSNETFIEGLRERNEELEKAYRELKETQEELLRAERLSALGKFASLIIHDIRNPLSILKGYAQMILMHIDDSARIKSSAEKIIKEAERLDKMTNDLLDFSRGDIRLNMSVINLEDFIDSLVEEIGERFESRGIEIEKRVDFSGPVMLDADRIYRVMMNLADNSRKAMEKGGKFIIHVTKDGQSVKFVVKDTGIGMSNSVKEKIFEPFFSYSHSGGTGLGMAIVKSIVEAHGGHVSVESEEKKGTTFTIRIPVLA